MQAAELDLAPHSRGELGGEFLSVATILFDSVKAAPFQSRANFPPILRNNNFAPLVLVTEQYAFIEIVGKAEARRRRPLETGRRLRRLFSPLSNDEPALFLLDRSRLARIGSLSLVGAHPFRLGRDVSLCAWDLDAKAHDGMRSQTDVHVDLIFVIGFGPSIGPSEAVQELDALVRVSVADWRAIR